MTLHERNLAAFAECCRELLGLPPRPPVAADMGVPDENGGDEGAANDTNKKGDKT